MPFWEERKAIKLPTKYSHPELLAYKLKKSKCAKWLL